MILIGYSRGSSLAALYLARHGERAERVVFSSPGEMWLGHGEGGGTGMVDRLSPGERWGLYMALLQPRALVTWMMHQAYVDRPETYFAVVRAFLRGGDLPVAPYVSGQPPPDFEGPVGDAPGTP